jgi:hypothetical protein
MNRKMLALYSLKFNPFLADCCQQIDLSVSLEHLPHALIRPDRSCAIRPDSLCAPYRFWLLP